MRVRLPSEAMNVTSDRSTRTFFFSPAIALNSLSILSAPSTSKRPERVILVIPFSRSTTVRFIAPSSVSSDTANRPLERPDATCAYCGLCFRRSLLYQHYEHPRDGAWSAVLDEADSSAESRGLIAR